MSRMRGYDAWLTTDPALDRETPCGAFSPDGALACNRDCEHLGDGDNTHEHWKPRREWFVVRPHQIELANFEGSIYELPAGAKVGDFLPSDGITTVCIERWPTREDDFDRDGNPTPRNTTTPTEAGQL